MDLHVSFDILSYLVGQIDLNKQTEFTETKEEYGRWTIWYCFRTEALQAKYVYSGQPLKEDLEVPPNQFSIVDVWIPSATILREMLSGNIHWSSSVPLFYNLKELNNLPQSQARDTILFLVGEVGIRISVATNGPLVKENGIWTVPIKCDVNETHRMPHDVLTKISTLADAHNFQQACGLLAETVLDVKITQTSDKDKVIRMKNRKIEILKIINKEK